MLDLVEGAKIMNGVVPTTQAASSGYGDWINMENFHCIWALCHSGVGTSGQNFQAYVSESYAAASPSRATAQYWTSTGVAIGPRMKASTNTTGAKISDAVAGHVVIRFDPATADSSDQYFSVCYSSGDAAYSITYIGETRYGGLAQFIATSSST